MDRLQLKIVSTSGSWLIICTQGYCLFCLKEIIDSCTLFSTLLQNASEQKEITRVSNVEFNSLSSDIVQNNPIIESQVFARLKHLIKFTRKLKEKHLKNHTILFLEGAQTKCARFR